MSNECECCWVAERDPRCDVYSSGCISCSARALAAIGAHIESQTLNVVTPHYRSVLEKIFGERWKVGAEEVKRWGALIDANAKHKKGAT